MSKMSHHITSVLQQSRPEFKDVWLRLAYDLASRSTCHRSKVGAVIVTPDNEGVLSIGYNGNYRGGSNGCDTPESIGGCGCIHAEANALIKCMQKIRDKIIYATHSPCMQCAKLLINSGIVGYYYLEDYRDQTAVGLFHKLGIKIEKCPVT